MSQGFSFESFASVVGAGRSTIYDWARDHPEFQAAKDEGAANSMKLYEAMMIKGMAGKIPGFKASACQWMMEKRFAEYSPLKDDGTLAIFNVNSCDSKQLLDMALEARKVKKEDEQKRISKSISEED